MLIFQFFKVLEWAGVSFRFQTRHVYVEMNWPSADAEETKEKTAESAVMEEVRQTVVQQAKEAVERTNVGLNPITDKLHEGHRVELERGVTELRPLVRNGETPGQSYDKRFDSTVKKAEEA
jgi:hypothetical protein